MAGAAATSCFLARSHATQTSGKYLKMQGATLTCAMAPLLLRSIVLCFAILDQSHLLY